MMPSTLIQHESDTASIERLSQLYAARLISAEKKPFLVDLKKSSGPFLAVANSEEFIFDGCSQIATLGLGFNASPLFATCQHLESWTGNYRTENILAIAHSYRNLLKRLLGDIGGQYEVHFCASGAEAIEISLGICYARRPNAAANKVLAFRGSFHGRMMVALSATWNRKKREPFAWPGFDSEFAPYPFIHGEDGVEIREQQSLKVIDRKLASEKFFAVLIEPMQCEGGDRYSSSQFHNQLIAIAKTHGVPVVYDEVQTGFHLGHEFFWHSQFNLTDQDGNATGPDVIACAKKSQVGVVISKHDIPFRETFCPASLIRGYTSAAVIDQFQDKIIDVAATVEKHLSDFVERHHDMIENPRSQGLAFAFDFRKPEMLGKFVGHRFNNGLLFYPAGQRTARFRLNLSFREPELQLLWQQLEDCLGDVKGKKPASSPIHLTIDQDSSYEFHSQFAESKLRGKTVVSALDYLNKEFSRLGIADSISVVLLDNNNYKEFRERILQAQKDTYEPARQTPAEEFDLLFDGQHNSKAPAILVLQDDTIMAMAFCGQISKFRQERGVSDDPFVDDEAICYMLDLTVAPEFRGGMGRIMKNALAMLATEQGVQAIHGRNRDRLARGMWAINLSLGSFETQHLKNDYPDDNEHRDCIYYRMPLTWKPGSVDDELPFRQLDLTKTPSDYFERNMPAVVNKICLSNFVSPEFLEDLETVVTTLPNELRQVYTSSSLSEAIDKVSKAIWLKRKPHSNLLTVDGHYFGEGSFLARSLSGVGDSFFPTTRIDQLGVAKQLKEKLDSESWLAFYVQTEQFVGQREILAECVTLCRQHQTPIVFNETGRRFGVDGQFSRDQSLMPDAGVAWLGGQMAITYTNDFLFADDPLLLISTWDGDSYALARFAETIRQDTGVVEND